MLTKIIHKKIFNKLMLLLLFWTLAVLGSLAFNIHSAHQETLVNASVAAEATINRDINFRSWAAKKGGIYVHPSTTTPSNPYLVHPLKDITTSDGVPLTLLNPAYLIRDIQESVPDKVGVKTKLVSQNPINPINLADSWEGNALKQFNNKQAAFTGISAIEGALYFRKIQPFTVEPECMVCHAHQGYKVGEIRGGITALIPLAPYLSSYELRKKHLYTSHLGVWLLGFIGFMAGFLRENKSATLQMHYLEDLELAAEVFDQSYEGILITDAKANIVDVNAAFERISGYSKAELLGNNPRINNSGRQGPEVYLLMWKDLLAKGFWQGEVWNQKKNGEIYAVTLSISAIYDSGNPRRVRNYLALFADITHIKDNESKLQHLAHYDVLTGLPNRLLLTERLASAMKQADNKASQLAVVYLDLDGFKGVNDEYGHDVGDQLLIELTRRMTKLIKDKDTLARIGGDEFVVVITQLAFNNDSKDLLNKLLEVTSNTIIINDQVLKVSASIGVSFYPADKVDAEQLLRHADQAMYVAKQEGKNCFRIFDPQVDQVIRDLSAHIKEIRQALIDNEFVLFYQPKINSRTNQLIGVEALIRWNHPQKGLLAPGQFLPAIKNHAIMLGVGRWVMKTAISQLDDWQQEKIACPISINMNSEFLQEDSFLGELSALLMAYPAVNPANLEVEVLETTAVEDFVKVSQALLGIRKLGLQISIDDFGTGYSSLSYLKHLPVNTLKIDQSFVRDLLDDPEDLAIVQGVISMASAFKLQVIAEGVETEQHGIRLLELGCEWVQGYGVSKPLPLDQLLKWLKDWEKEPKWLK